MQVISVLLLESLDARTPGSPESAAGEVIGICFWGQARRSGSPPPREAAGAAGHVPFSLPARSAGVSGARDAEVKGELGSPGYRGAHDRAGASATQVRRPCR